jgi:hypothetical protein
MRIGADERPLLDSGTGVALVNWNTKVVGAKCSITFCIAELHPCGNIGPNVTDNVTAHVGGVALGVATDENVDLSIELAPNEEPAGPPIKLGPKSRRSKASFDRVIVAVTVVIMPDSLGWLNTASTAVIESGAGGAAAIDLCISIGSGAIVEINAGPISPSSRRENAAAPSAPPKSKASAAESTHRASSRSAIRNLSNRFIRTPRSLKSSLLVVHPRCRRCDIVSRPCHAQSSNTSRNAAV